MTVTPMQLIEDYLGHLRQMLSEAEPAEREEILAAVREHLNDSLDGLGHEPSVEDVQQALRELGPAEEVVEAWANGAGGRPTPEIAGPSTRRGRLLAVATVALAVASVVVIIANPLLALPLQLALIVAGLVGARRDPIHRGLYRAAAGIAGLGAAISVVLVLLLFSAGDEPAEPMPGDPVPVQSP